jgi:hypothetical protein
MRPNGRFISCFRLRLCALTGALFLVFAYQYLTMAKSLSGTTFIKGKPKRTRQGQSPNSKPRHNKKLSRGQGR